LAFSFFGKPSFFVLSLIFAFIAIASATYDIACDGYYLASLDKSKQALYVGWRNTAYKIAWIFGSGGLVYLAGKIAAHDYLAKIAPRLFIDLPANNTGWFVAFSIAASIFIMAGIVHCFILPVSHNVSPLIQNEKRFLPAFTLAFASFFQQSKIAFILSWILTFRAGDAMLLKMAQPFLLDSRTKGGLGLSLLDVGFVYGGIGTIALLIGGLIGSWLVFKYGLKKCLMPTAIAQSVTLLLYWFLATYKPALAGVAAANVFEQFVYGLASTAYTSYLFTILKDKFLTSHYAIATGFMAAGIMLPGAVSGYLADGLGYEKFFLFSFFCSVPGLFLTAKLPFTKDNEHSID
jgi:PAT family beta-lactamase induction signal transducer AmpG